MTDLAQRRLRAVNAISARVSDWGNTPASRSDRALDDLVRLIYGVGDRPEGDEPYVGWQGELGSGIPKRAEFEMKLKPSPKLLYGTFKLFDEKSEICSYRATSGQPGYQTPEHFRTLGKGCCPPYDKLFILTDGYYLPSAGIGGDFFQIVPNPVPGWGRSELGLHADRNRITSPGSAGCVVLDSLSDFDDGCVPLLDYALTQGVKQIPLKVNYE